VEYHDPDSMKGGDKTERGNLNRLVIKSS